MHASFFTVQAVNAVQVCMKHRTSPPARHGGARPRGPLSASPCTLVSVSASHRLLSALQCTVTVLSFKHSEETAFNNLLKLVKINIALPLTQHSPSLVFFMLPWGGVQVVHQPRTCSRMCSAVHPLPQECVPRRQWSLSCGRHRPVCAVLP